MSSLSDNNNNQILWPVKPGTGPVKVNPKADFTDLDHQVLDFWDRKSVFQRSIDERKNCPVYIAYDGPPGTNGIPHIGHIMQSALKDLWPRYYTMKGYRVLRKAGWDTHGLPVELTAEKELGLHSKRDIKKFGVEKYIKYCRETVFRYKEAWTNAIRRCGRFLDTDNYYATLTNDYIQTDWWVLKQAWKKGLLYQGHRVMPHCTRCGTSLSSHETAQGYKDISDISLFVKFQLKDNPDTYFIAWTTTAWTLLFNIALAVNDKLTYLTVKVGNEKYIFAESLLGSLCKHFGDQEYHILERRLGKYLEGQKYIPLWSFLNNIEGNAHQVVVDDYVTAEDGSGIVHLALYGEDDFRIIQKNKIPM
ncbi:class I tRNA ligase family protein, partial [bacterium]|nr:class I tRNA ligase family protein [bacterium]